MQDSFDKASDWIENADAILIAAGAGMGVDSGLPDFRSANGLWREYPALGQQDMSFYDIANPRNFVSDPRTVWGFYGHRLKLYRDTNPHDGFSILKKWAGQKPNGYFIYTSNVDGQFQKAGFDPERIYECHGSIHQMQCCDYCPDTWSSESFQPVINQEQCELLSNIPICPQCGYTARPNIFMFSDAFWDDSIYQDQQVRYQQWLEEAENIVVLEIGAGTNIPTVRHQSERIARGKLIRINPQEPDVPKHLGVSFASGASEALLLLDCLLSERNRDRLIDETHKRASDLTLDDILDGKRIEQPEIYPTFEEAVAYDQFSNAQEAIRDLLRIEQAIRNRDGMCKPGGEFYWERRHSFSQWYGFFGINIYKHDFELEETSPLYLRDFLAGDGLEFAVFKLDIDCKDTELLEDLLQTYEAWVKERF